MCGKKDIWAVQNLAVLYRLFLMGFLGRVFFDRKICLFILTDLMMSDFLNSEAEDLDKEKVWLLVENAKPYGNQSEKW